MLTGSVFMVQWPKFHWGMQIEFPVVRLYSTEASIEGMLQYHQPFSKIYVILYNQGTRNLLSKGGAF